MGFSTNVSSNEKRCPVEQRQQETAEDGVQTERELELRRISLYA